MDLVVRTSHGEAEISLRLDGAAIGDVVERVTGRPSPTVVYVDGRATPSSTPLDDAGILTGSVVSTDDDELPPAAPFVVLEQVAGPGAGSTAPLLTGRHLIGPGRRVSTAELGRAPVDEPVFQLDVAADGTVEVTARHRDVRLDGNVLVDEATASWGDEILDVGGRAFRLGRDHRASPGSRTPSDRDRGTLPFNRPPRAIPTQSPRPPSTRERPPRRFRHGTDARRGADATVAVQRAVERRRLRSGHLDPVDALEWARRTDPRLWERRPDHPDAYQVAVGLADVPWTPQPMAPGADPGSSGEAALAALAMVPVSVDLRVERSVGVAGSDDFTAGIARSVVLLAATMHGPADLDVIVLAGPDRAHTWEWAKWLPHNRPEGTPRLLVSRDQVEGWASAVRSGSTPSRSDGLTLVVVDEPALWRDRASPLRPLLADRSLPLRFLTLAPSVDDVPSSCTLVISRRPDERVVVDRPRSQERIEDVRPYLLEPHLALDAARALAPLEDPDLPVHDEPPLLPAVALPELLDVPEPTPSMLEERWQRSDARPVARLGTTGTGTLTVDLVDDGPHLVVTGRARSELVDQIVLSLAVELAPGDLEVVWVGSTSGAGVLARLPHTVGRITDVDDHGVRRLLRCLRAELRRRERATPTSLLLVVVEDLDALGGDPSDTWSSWNDLARRGPGLGVHLVAARSRAGTARHRAAPIGDAASVAVDVPSADEVRDGLFTPGPASDRLWPSVTPAGVARIGDRRPQPFRPAATHAVDGIDLRPFVVARDLVPMEQRLDRTGRAGVDDVGRLLDAFERAGLGPTALRSPVPPPLPVRLPARELFDAHPGDGVPYALADLPDEQAQGAAWWSPGPGDDGQGILAIGAPGSGTSSLLVTLLLGAAERFSADELHVHVVDADAGGLAALAELPHVGAVVGPDDPDGAARLLHVLAAELDRRAADADHVDRPTIVLAVDGIGGLHHQLEGRRDLEPAWPQLEAIVRDGASLGITVLITAGHLGDVPAPFVETIAERLAFDARSASALGLDAVDVVPSVPGRALRTSDGAEVQCAEPPEHLGVAVAALGAEPALERPPARLDPLPHSVTVDEIVPFAESTEGGVLAPVGLDRTTGEPARLPLRRGENVFVTGPAGSGRSSVLVAAADAVVRSDPGVAVFAAALHGGPLTGIGDRVDVVRQRSEVGDWMARLLSTTGARVVLVDDADRTAGPEFDRLGALREPGLTVVVAGSNDGLRAAAHWSRPLQRFRRGVLLEPAPTDGDLLRVSLGARVARQGVHTGLLVDDGDIVPLLAAVATDVRRTEPG